MRVARASFHVWNAEITPAKMLDLRVDDAKEIFVLTAAIVVFLDEYDVSEPHLGLSVRYDNRGFCMSSMIALHRLNR